MPNGILQMRSSDPVFRVNLRKSENYAMNLYFLISYTRLCHSEFGVR